jgi:hypothetical protein
MAQAIDPTDRRIRLRLRTALARGADRVRGGGGGRQLFDRRRRERGSPMALWQMDVAGGCLLCQQQREGEHENAARV